MAIPRSDYVSILEGKARLYRRKGSSSWQVRFNIGPRKYIRESLDTDNFDDAKTKAIVRFARMSERVDQGRSHKPATFNQAAQAAINDLIAEKNINARTSARDYKLAIENALVPYFTKINPKRLEAITEDDLQAFIEWRGTEIGREPAKSTVANYVGAMVRLWKTAVKNGWIKKTDVPKFPRKEGKTEARPYLEPTEYQKIIDHLHKFIIGGRRKLSRVIRSDFVPMLPILRHSGMRPGTEVKSLKWGSFTTFKTEDDRDYISIKVLEGKTDAREVVCSAEIVDALMDHQRRKLGLGMKAVFPVPLNHPLYHEPIFARGKDEKGRWKMTNQSEYSRAFNKLLSDLGIRLDLKDEARCLYSLRHLYATERLSKGVTSDILATQMGTSVMVIEEYYKKLKSRANAAKLAKHIDMADVAATNERNKTDVSTFAAMELLRAVFGEPGKKKSKSRKAA